MHNNFWSNSTVAVIGGGSWGTVLAELVSQNVREVRVWLRSVEGVREMNATRTNPQHFPEMRLDEKIHALSEFERVFEGNVDLVIWALPSKVCREQAQKIAPYLKGNELILHATKGIEGSSMKRISEVLLEELPCPRVGVISGPNLAKEIAQGEPAATIIASRFSEVCEAGQEVLMTDKFRVYRSQDIVGVEWAGVLKNILAIAAGALEGLKLGWNARAMLLTRGLAEMARFGQAMGSQESTFLGLAGVGDVFATCSSPLSRNYQIGRMLGSGKDLKTALEELGSTAEGISTAETVRDFSRKESISMPITEGVCELIEGRASAEQVLHSLMTRPPVGDS